MHSIEVKTNEGELTLEGLLSGQYNQYLVPDAYILNNEVGISTANKYDILNTIFHEIGHAVSFHFRSCDLALPNVISINHQDCKFYERLSVEQEYNIHDFNDFFPKLALNIVSGFILTNEFPSLSFTEFTKSENPEEMIQEGDNRYLVSDNGVKISMDLLNVYHEIFPKFTEFACQDLFNQCLNNLPSTNGLLIFNASQNIVYQMASNIAWYCYRNNIIPPTYPDEPSLGDIKKLAIDAGHEVALVEYMVEMSLERLENQRS